MEVFIASILFSITIYIVVNLYLKEKLKSFLYTTTFILLLSPSSLMLGFSNSSVLNIQFSYFFILCILPIFFFIHKRIFWNRRIINNYLRDIGRFLILIILIKFFLSISRLFLYDANPFIDFANSTKEFIFILILTFFYYSIFYSLNSKEKIDFVKHTLGLFTIIAAIFGIAVLWNIFPFNEIQNTYFEFKSINSNGVEISLTESILRDNRSYSFFSAANQYGTYSAIGVSIAAILFKQRNIRLVLFYLILISSILIIYSSQSRTALFFFLIFLPITLFSRNLKSIVLILFLILLIPLFYEFIPLRLINSFNQESFSSNLESQRLSFWLKFTEKAEFTADFVLNGFYNSNFLKNNPLYFESGILNFISKHGVLIFILFFYLFIKSILFTVRNKFIGYNKILGQITFWVLIILVSGEIFQGWVLNFRYETISSIFLAIAYLKQEPETLN